MTQILSSQGGYVLSWDCQFLSLKEKTNSYITINVNNRIRHARLLWESAQNEDLKLTRIYALAGLNTTLDTNNYAYFCSVMGSNLMITDLITFHCYDPLELDYVDLSPYELEIAGKTKMTTTSTDSDFNNIFEEIRLTNSCLSLTITTVFTSAIDLKSLPKSILFRILQSLRFVKC